MLSRARVLLLGFDGPVCHLIAGHPARQVADAVRACALEHGDALSEPQSDDSLVRLRVAYTSTRPSSAVTSKRS